MGKIYCLLGKSGSGKSTIEKEIENLGIKRIISTTSRAMREHEKEGIDYHYVSDEAFNQLIKNNNLLEHTIYNNWQYGIDKDYNKIDLENNNYIVVVEPNGFHQLLKSVGKKNIYSYYIDINDKEHLLRCLNREENPNCKEICRRFLSDIDLFDGIKNEVNEIIYNDDLRDSINTIYEQIIGKEIENFKVGNEVIIKDIINKDKVPDLLQFIGKIGYIFSWKFSGHIKKYKVVFNPNTPNELMANFNGEELELIKE